MLSQTIVAPWISSANTAPRSRRTTAPMKAPKFTLLAVLALAGAGWLWHGEAERQQLQREAGEVDARDLGSLVSRTPVDDQVFERN